MRGCGRIERPAFPAPSDVFRWHIKAKLACMRRDRVGVALTRHVIPGRAPARTRNLEIPRCTIAHLRSGPSDHPGMTTQKAADALDHGLLRCARNDEKWIKPSRCRPGQAKRDPG